MSTPLLITVALVGAVGALFGQDPREPASVLPLVVLGALVELTGRRVAGVGYLSGASAVYLALGWQPVYGVRLMLVVSCALWLVRMFKDGFGRLAQKVEETLLDALPVWGSCVVVGLMQAFFTPDQTVTAVVGLIVYSALVSLACRLRALGRTEEQLESYRRNHFLLFSAPAFLAPLLLGPQSWMVVLATPLLCLTSFIKMDFEAEQSEQQAQREAGALSHDLARTQQALDIKKEERALMEQLTRSFARTKNLDETLQLAVDTIAKLLSAQSVVFFLRHGDGVRPRAWRSALEEQIKGSTCTEPIVEECWKSGKVILSQPHHIHAARILEGEQFAVALPLARFGVLYVGRSIDRPYTRKQLLLLALVTDQTIPPILAGLRQAELALALDQQVVINKKLDQALLELKESQAQLVHSSKLAAVGQLSAGVAHEINSPLAAVVLHIQSAKRRLRKGKTDRVESKLDDALEASRSAKTIIENLLEYARPGEEKLEAKELDTLITNALSIIGQPEGIELQTRLGAGVQVEVNRMEIQQILTNLVMNAQQALVEAQVPEAAVLVESRVENGEARVYVKDNGPGVPADVQERIFEPFFTTKAVGDGTGLGLSISLKLAERNSGRLEYIPNHRGACFQLSLPILKEPS